MPLLEWCLVRVVDCLRVGALERRKIVARLRNVLHNRVEFKRDVEVYRRLVVVFAGSRVRGVGRLICRFVCRLDAGSGDALSRNSSSSATGSTVRPDSTSTAHES
jgi:hypothetical protein